MQFSQNRFDMLETGKRISEYRKRMNLTQLALADRLNISYQAVSNWERGESMPDVSKLPELASIFNVTIDDILSNRKLAEFLTQVRQGNTDELLRRADITATDVLQAAPLLEPAQMDALADDGEWPCDVGQLCELAPFVSKDTLGNLVMRVEATTPCDIDALCGLAPFLSREALDRLVMRIEATTPFDIGALCGLAPFLSRQALDRLVMRIEEITSCDIGALCGLAPFVSKDTLSNLVMRIEEITSCDIGALCGLAPFLSREALDRLVMRATQTPPQT